MLEDSPRPPSLKPPVAIKTTALSPREHFFVSKDTFFLLRHIWTKRNYPPYIKGEQGVTSELHFRPVTHGVRCAFTSLAPWVRAIAPRARERVPRIKAISSSPFSQSSRSDGYFLSFPRRNFSPALVLFMTQVFVFRSRECSFVFLVVSSWTPPLLLLLFDVAMEPRNCRWDSAIPECFFFAFFCPEVFLFVFSLLRTI